MKHRIIHIALLIFWSVWSLAQTEVDTIEQLLSEDKVEAAEMLLNSVISEDSTNAKLYLYKALIFQNRLNIDLTNNEKKVLLNQIQKYLDLSVEKDENQSLLSIQKEEYLTLNQQLLYTGISFFNDKNYKEALELFETNINISALPFIQEFDTILWFNAALASEKSLQFDKAEYYYSNIVLNKIGAWQSYIALANIYKAQNKTQNFVETLKQAEQNYPENKLQFYNEFISFYLEQQQFDSSLIYIDKTLESDSLNDKLYYLKGSVYQEITQNNKAIASYKKALNINPKNVDAAFNMAAIYYNQAIDIYKKGKLKRKEKKNLTFFLNQSVNNLLIVHEQEPDNINVIKMIHSCYTMLKSKKNQKIFEDKINQIKK